MRSRAYSTFWPLLPCRRSASGKTNNERIVLSKATIASLLAQLAHKIDGIHPAALGWGEPCTQAFKNLRERRLVERFKVCDLESLQYPCTRFQPCPSTEAPYADGAAGVGALPVPAVPVERR